MRNFRLPSFRLAPQQSWMILFGLWTFLLSGALSNFVGSPGALQILRLWGLRDHKQGQLRQIQAEVKQLQTTSNLLEHSSSYQEREIRRVLGYAAADELIFDFVPNGSQ